MVINASPLGFRKAKGKPRDLELDKMCIELILGMTLIYKLLFSPESCDLQEDHLN